MSDAVTAVVVFHISRKM